MKNKIVEINYDIDSDIATVFYADKTKIVIYEFNSSRVPEMIMMSVCDLYCADGLLCEHKIDDEYTEKNV